MEAFRRDLKSIGADPSKFGLHSLRSGGASIAASNSVSDTVAGGRCKPEIEDHLDQRLAVSKFLGL